MVILESRVEVWDSEEACVRSAGRLAIQAPVLLHQAVIELHGDLGAGKTTFVRNLLRALGISGAIKSPTYAIMEAYELPIAESPLAISHFDFYRFNDPQEWEDAGFRDVFATPGLKLLEWPEQARALLPTPDLQLRLETLADHRRQVRWDAGSPRGTALLPPAVP